MIIVTYIDNTDGEENTVKLAKRSGMTRTGIAHRGMRKLFGKRWRMRYQILNVTDESASEEEYEKEPES